MKKLIKLTAMALCTLTLCLTSCSKDDNNENIGGKEKELTKEQKIVMRVLEELDPNGMTPLEALLKLNELKKILNRS